MKEKLQLCPDGLTFDPKKHTYFYKGKYLSGITGRIGKRLNVKMPGEFVGEAQAEGLHIHGAIEKWLKTGSWESVHPGACWVQRALSGWWAKPGECCHSEVLVSDGKQYASSVDIVGVRMDGKLVLYDIKRSFKRVYVTWQLSIYKYLIEKYTKYQVAELFCLAVRDKMTYPIFEYPVHDVEEMLYGSSEDN